MRQFSFACMLGYAYVMAAPAHARTHSEISVVAGLQNFVIDSGVDSGEVKILTDKTTHAIQFVNGKPHLVPADAPSSPVAPPNMLPHASVTQDERNIAAAWLATATTKLFWCVPTFMMAQRYRFWRLAQRALKFLPKPILSVWHING
jgi:hypothetical protein